MKEFLHDIANEIYARYPKLEEVTLVFPNRRAIIYFRKHLGAIINKPAFAPSLVTIEDFISNFSSYRVPDKLELVYRLYKTYTETVQSTEAFDKFYFWGEMLLRDFDDIDKYMVNAEMIFKDLSNQKELDATFDYLTGEQKEFLLDFWGNFDVQKSENKKKFLEVWKQLGKVYTAFRKQLKQENLAYDGMLHREVAEQTPASDKEGEAKLIYFIGFNALTKAEEVILSHFIRKGSKVFWDIDEYYVNSKPQEAGVFFRAYQEHPILGSTFPSTLPSNFRKPKSVKVFGAAQPVGQAKLMAQVLADQVSEGAKPEETLIVLPDEKLLLPVLHGISDKVEKLNVTMGFPLSSTPMFNLIEFLVELQISRKEDHFNHRPVLSILSHPYGIAADPGQAHAKSKEINQHNWISIPRSFLATGCELHRLIFSEAEVNTITDYLRKIILCVGSLESLAEFDKEYAFQFLKCVNRIEEVLGNQYSDLNSFLRFFRQFIRSQKIPFSGEPLQGLQIMGMLETRNLDFRNVYLLSLNEGSLPTGERKGSYLPFNIRRAYGLPIVQHQDAMYAYLFYRVIQRAENVFLFYNTETDILGQGEMSRFLLQLLYESGLDIQIKTLHNSINLTPVNPIRIGKSKQVMDALIKLNEGNQRSVGISPSALNAYLECRLRFYLRYVMKIKEPNEVEDDMDARVLGNFLHKVMDKFYKNLGEKKSGKIEASDFEESESEIAKILEEEIKTEYRLHPDKPVLYEGQMKLVSEIVKRFANRILKRDKKYAPFILEGAEQELSYSFPISGEPKNVVLGGVIDRIDCKENVVRIVDYKTGRDKLEFDSIESLFSRDKQRNKAAFQILTYAWLYSKRATAGVKIKPGLINTKILFDEKLPFGLSMARVLVTDAYMLMPEFEARLKEVVEELFNPEVPFTQTNEVKTCEYCPYKKICYR